MIHVSRRSKRHSLWVLTVTLKEGWLHKNSQKNIFTGKRVSQEGRGERNGGETGVERRVGGGEPEMNPMEAGRSCHHTGASITQRQWEQRSPPPRHPLTCADSTLPDHAPCGFNDKGVCAAVHERARLITHPLP